jgi:hypothetical protein
MLYHIPEQQGFDEAQKIMASLTTLRPDLVQNLLETCRSVKVKRLFMYMADKEEHVWFDDLDSQQLDLGSGKRVIIKDGKLDKKYGITIPRSSEY